MAGRHTRNRNPGPTLNTDSAMTYLYETIPTQPGEKPKFFELKQSMKDAPFTHHPETGEPIRRVILGGWGLTSKMTASGSQSGDDCGCGPSGCC